MSLNIKIKSMCSHQDFNEINLGKTTTVNNKPAPQISRELKKIQMLENDEIVSPQNVPLSVRKQLESGRMAKNMTQTELAKQLGIKVNDYNRIECGKEPLEGNLKAKVQKILNIKIKTTLYYL